MTKVFNKKGYPIIKVEGKNALELNFELLEAIKLYPYITKAGAILVKESDDYLAEAEVEKGMIVLSTRTVIESSRTYLASLLVHEMHHIDQHKRGMRHSKEAEKEAYAMQIMFLIEQGERDEADYVAKEFHKEYSK